jgi:two-component system, NtrC family, sensor kinase
MENLEKIEPSSLKILLVDDHLLFLDLYTRVLRKKGYFTLAVSSAADALEVIVRGLTKVDLIITDINMPELSGIQLYEIVKTRRPDLTDKIIFITGGILSGEMGQVLNKIPNPKIQKPFEIEQLLKAISLVSSET